MRTLGPVILLILVGFGCSREEPSHGTAESGVEYYDAKGTVLWHEEGRLYLNHEEIPGFMDAMAMGFPLSDPALVEGLEAGTTVQFRVAVEPDIFYIDRIERVD